MSDHFRGKYNFVPISELVEALSHKFSSVDQLHHEVCDNPLIIFKLFRYESMGCYTVIADVKGHPDKVFVLTIGGPNVYHAHDNYQKNNRLTLNDAKSIKL